MAATVVKGKDMKGKGGKDISTALDELSDQRETGGDSDSGEAPGGDEACPRQDERQRRQEQPGDIYGLCRKLPRHAA